MNARTLTIFVLLPLSILGEPQIEEIIGPSSGLTSPFGVAFDDKGNAYIAEYKGGRILPLNKSRKMSVLSGAARKGYAGDGLPAEQGLFNSMHNLARASNKVLFISDTHNYLVRKIKGNINRSSTIVVIPNQSGFSEDGGLVEKAKLDTPISISLTPDVKTLLIADIRNRRIRAVDIDSGVILTLAGNGKKGKPIDGKLNLEQSLIVPRAAIMNETGNLFVLERSGNALRVVHQDGKIYTLAGTGKNGQRNGPALQSSFCGPKHLCLDRKGRIIIADDNNHLIRIFDPKNKSVSTILSGQSKPKISLNRPHGVALAPDGSLWICNSWNDQILILKNYLS